MHGGFTYHIQQKCRNWNSVVKWHSDLERTLILYLDNNTVNRTLFVYTCEYGLSIVCEDITAVGHH